MTLPNARHASPANSPNDPQRSSRDAALRGAASAFSNKSTAPRLQPGSSTATTALAAATKVGVGAATAPADALPRQWTGAGRRTPALSKSSSFNTLHVPSDAVDRTPSPSNIAAKLAAARHSPQRKPEALSYFESIDARGQDVSGNIGSKMRPAAPSRQVSSQIGALRAAVSSGANIEEHSNMTDDAPIAPTNSLARLYEEEQSSPKPVDRSTRLRPIVLPRPEPEAADTDEMYKPPIKRKPVQLREIKTKAMPPAGSGTPDRVQTAHQAAVPVNGLDDMLSSPSSYASAPEAQEREANKPSLPPPRRSGKVGDYSSMATKSIDLYHSPYQRESSRQVARHMTGESLANAVVGAALASSRTASPAGPASVAPVLPLRPPPTKHDHSPLSRSPSPRHPKHPPGKLRMTMRKESSSSSDESGRHHRKGHRLGMHRKHAHAHSEATRKRWRDAITARERKRYEGVWAANKGLYMPEQHALDVLDLVTKEIWLRSRLPNTVLEEVWALVDARGERVLRKEEFVVGLWLIDQRLKGRKLPIRVSDSVWASVRGAGVKVGVGK